MMGFWRHSQAKQWLYGLALGLCVALLSLLPYFSLLEEKLGLGLLFNLRGERAAPPEVVVVPIDRESASLLAAPNDTEKWPRRHHADLIRRLHAAGVGLIGFNIFFSGEQAADDEEMAKAMREAGTVVLTSFLRLKHLQGDAYMQTIEEPPASLTQAALATEPFLLAEGEETDRYLIHHGDSGEHPTFPLAMLRLYAAQQLGGNLPYLLLGDNQPPEQGVMPQAQSPVAIYPAFAGWESLFATQPWLPRQVLGRLRESGLTDKQQAYLQSLVETMTGSNTRVFNHYGTADAIPRVPYHELLNQPAERLRSRLKGRLALVGFSEDFQADQTATPLYSPYSPVNTLDLVATATANLLNHDDINPVFGLWRSALWLSAWGTLLGWLSTKRLRVGIGMISLLSLAYFAVAVWLFGGYSLWLPVILPMFWITPLALMSCLVGNYVVRSRENRKIHSVIDRFIPREATNRESQADAESPWESKISFGVCLATDAGQYTALAETLNPMDLGELMNEYYAALFPAVTQNGGWVSDVIGDAMMAIWTVPTARGDTRAAALWAALQIQQAVEQFQSQHRVSLPIRMGIHCGEVRLGFVGGKENAAYRAVGDTVNTAARLESLNKLLGTQILVSLAQIDDLPGFLTRPVGRFRLAGKAHPVDVYELISPARNAEPKTIGMIDRFIHALSLFQSGDWEAAALGFENLLQDFPDDGPSQFYVKTARNNAENPLATPDLAAIAVNKPPPGSLSSA